MIIVINIIHDGPCDDVESARTSLPACICKAKPGHRQASDADHTKTENAMSEQYSLCVMVHVKPEHLAEFANRVSDNVAETRKDEGLITFNYHKVVGAPIWVLYEIWESEQHSDVHRQKPDVQAFFAQSERLLSREPEIYRLEPSA